MRHWLPLLSSLLHHEALSLLFLRNADAGERCATAPKGNTPPTAAFCRQLFQVFSVICNHGENGALKDLLDTRHFPAAALHIPGTHLLGNGEALLSSYWRKTLGLKHVDTRLLIPQVGLEADENERGVGAEMQDFGVPLFECQLGVGGRRAEWEEWVGPDLVHDIFEGIWAIDGKADEDQVGFGIRKRA